jgi:C_GCAxxG_C_C family probable redox protein
MEVGMDEKHVGEQVKKARLLHWQRLSCSESVWLALNSDLDPDQQRFGSKLAVGFAGGIASGSLCGAVAGAVMAISAKFAHYPEEARSVLVRELEERLYAEVSASIGSAYCRDLKPDDGTQRRVCNQIIGRVCEIAARIIVENKDRIHSDI